MHSGFTETNVTLYSYDFEKQKYKLLTKNQKYERTFASSAGGLKSSLSDLIKFTKIPKLLEGSLKLLSELYFVKKKDEKYVIEHGGGIYGGVSKIKIVYDNEWTFKNIDIKLETL